MADADGQPGLRVLEQESRARVESVNFLSSQANSSIPPNYLTAVFYNGRVSERTPSTRPRMSK